MVLPTKLYSRRNSLGFKVDQSFGFFPEDSLHVSPTFFDDLEAPPQQLNNQALLSTNFISDASSSSTHNSSIFDEDFSLVQLSPFGLGGRNIVSPQASAAVTAIANSFMDPRIQGNNFLDSTICVQQQPSTIDAAGAKSQGSDSTSAPGATSNKGSKSKKAKEEIDSALGLPPLRALSAYNFFFRDERERLLYGGEMELNDKKCTSLLNEHWNRDRTKKRRHRKTHGKIPFTELSKIVSRKWKALTDSEKDFYRQVSSKDWERYQKEVDAYKLKQQQHEQGLQTDKDQQEKSISTSAPVPVSPYSAIPLAPPSMPMPSSVTPPAKFEFNGQQVSL